jgi:hypothetical protein
MNGYNLLRDWFNFKFANPSKTKASHSDFYCYLIDRWNRLGQKHEFGLPTSVTMEALGIGSYNTYKKTLNDLIEFGFVTIVSESKNQHQSKIIAISKSDKAIDKALDEANNKATDKATDTIYKQENNRTIEQINKLDIDFYFDQFWNAYNRKVNRKKTFELFKKIKPELFDLIIDKAHQYAQSTPDIQFRKHPNTWLNGRCWEDEIILTHKQIQNEITTITSAARDYNPNL